jgi:DedD protein
MAPPESPEASEIRRRGRQRLIGAVAIALLLIVFIPMLLDSEPRSARQEPKLEIPPRDTAPALPAPRPESPAETAAKPPPALPAEARPAPPPKVAVVEPKAAPATVPKADPKPAAEPKGAVRMEGFAIQVGAFKDEATLKQARDKLTAANIASYTEPSGGLTRLRVGPFATRDAAEKSAAAVRKAVPDAKVVPLQ